ncbi:MAG: WD40/YVTN/BNR-like repeat-containing protein [Gammaproteobacteria bacterium]
MSNTRISIVLVACSLGLPAGCMQPPDLSKVRQSERQSVHRFDNFLSVASNPQVAVAGTDAGVIVSSADRGKNWVRHPLGALSSIISIASCPDGSFAALDYHSKVWTSAPDGRRWESRALEKDFSPSAIACAPDGRLWVVGSYSTVASSIDHGKTWTRTSLDEDMILTTVQFIDAHTGFVSGEFGTFAHTSDAGVTWTREAPLPDELYPFSAYFFNADVGVINGSDGTSLQTWDAGKTWQQLRNPARARLYALTFADHTLVGVGAGGVVAKLCGFEWTPLPISSDRRTDLLAAVPAQSGSILSVGPGGTLLPVDLNPPLEVTASW